MLTLVVITSRPEPRIDWLLSSLYANRATHIDLIAEIIVVDALAPRDHGPMVTTVAPKPTVWSGPHRLTQADWWSASNARNTGLCLTRTSHVCFLDDRLVLEHRWIDAVKDAIDGEYVAVGPYQKRTGMTVEHGIIRHGGIVTGEDHRLAYVKEHWSDPRHKLTNPYRCGGEWLFACCIVMPTEWALEVGGYDETCDGLSSEDTMFGLMLANNGFPIRYDTRLSVIEDRSPEHVGTVMLRKDKGVSPLDKSHKLLENLRNLKHASHQWNMRRLRCDALSGRPWPVPTEPSVDWYDGQPLKEMI